jgi:hypothetical protein
MEQGVTRQGKHQPSPARLARGCENLRMTAMIGQSGTPAGSRGARQEMGSRNIHVPLMFHITVIRNSPFPAAASSFQPERQRRQSIEKT